MKIWELLGGLTTLIFLILWAKWLRTPSPSSTWPRQNYLRVTLIYIIPMFLLLLSGLGINAFAESLGASESFGLIVVGIPGLLMPIGAVMILLHLWGMPMPPFLVPRWIRAQDREHRRLKRTARQRRWQDSKAKKADVWFNISIPFIVIAIVVVTFFIIVGIASLFV